MIIALLISNPAYAQFWGTPAMMQPLYLVGPRGLWENTIGMALAQAAGFRFADTDRWLQSHVRMSVADIVEKEGWEGFALGNRGLETDKRAFDCHWRRERYYSHGVPTDVICTVLA